MVFPHQHKRKEANHAGPDPVLATVGTAAVVRSARRTQTLHTRITSLNRTNSSEVLIVAQRRSGHLARLSVLKNRVSRLGRLDPTHTTVQRMAFERAVAKRFRDLKKTILQAVGEDDVLGLAPVPHTLGGPGSGYFGHPGRIGQVGGSTARVATEDVPEFVYVGTKAEWYHGFEGSAWPSIKEAGLRAKLKGTWTHPSNRRDTVYVARTPEMARAYARSYTDAVVLRVRTSVLDRNAFYKDPLDVPEESGLPNQYAYMGGDIPTSAIEVFEEFKTLGGAGSGNFGHAGRPGEVGGSAPALSIADVDKLLERGSLTNDEKLHLEFLSDHSEESYMPEWMAKVDGNYQQVRGLLRSKDIPSIDERSLKKQLLMSEDPFAGPNWPVPVYVSAAEDDKATIGLLLHQDGHFEEFEGNDEATPETYDLVDDLLGVGERMVTVWSNQPADIAAKLKAGERPEGVYVSPKREHAEGYWAEGRELVSFKIPLRSVARESDVDWKIRPLKTHGGPGSGNYGHAGRPGQVGGSGPSFATALDGATVADLKQRFVNGVRLYRGVKEPGQRPSDPGDFGVGVYHSTDRAEAKEYGAVSMSVVRFTNPLVLTATEAYDQLADVFHTVRPPKGVHGDDTQAYRKRAAELATESMIKAGYDGLVVVHDRQWSRLEVVVFPSSVTHSIKVHAQHRLPARAFAFKRDDEKLEDFMAWLREEIDKGILSVTRQGTRTVVGNRHWMNLFIHSAYRRGLQRGVEELRKRGVKPSQLPAVPIEPIDAMFLRPIHADRVGLLFTRAFEELKGVSEQMATGISRSLAESMAEGRHPLQAARILMKRVEMSLARARMVARTEFIRAHHVANVNTYREAGVIGVRIRVEWSATGNIDSDTGEKTFDSRVCPKCKALDGKIFTLDEIEPLIPAHPNCRCAAIPADVGEPEQEQRDWEEAEPT